ncbi:hypothetical protein AZF37_09020 [endosymbiont 'TC1' of Trimyema compressum]|uniref:hypothetical protein n=1 Tax=endosymbiont 'TC1' of Trimyema compressum TaxID=243899 RepID=UPI0007F15E1E|nr:hypothetical protein [endosymbiont 'TC1' of Trimyema compressum]AMP21264.1 hypothetical protein AZF37_09020 [endosymbiont 'TC1' of Trimyema compressum]
MYSAFSWAFHYGYFNAKSSVTRINYCKRYISFSNYHLHAQGYIDDCDIVKLASPIRKTISIGDPIPEDTNLVAYLRDGYTAKKTQPIDFSIIGEKINYGYYRL